MKLTTTLTTEEFEKELTRKAIKGIVHTALVLNQCYDAFWNRPTEHILCSINANITETLLRFQSNTAIGNAVNAQLELTDFNERVITVMPDGYSFKDGLFVFEEAAKEIEVVVEQ